MKFPHLAVVMSLASVLPLPAQMDIPGNPMVTPKNFKTRTVGGGTNPGATVQSAEPNNGKVRHVGHIVLFNSRVWTSTEGKPLEAKLLAFEDLIAEAPAGVEPIMPKPPTHPTVVKNGGVRLLAGTKPVVVPLKRLSHSDCEFIAGIEAALARKSAKEK